MARPRSGAGALKGNSLLSGAGEGAFGERASSLRTFSLPSAAGAVREEQESGMVGASLGFWTPGPLDVLVLMFLAVGLLFIFVVLPALRRSEPSRKGAPTGADWKPLSEQSEDASPGGPTDMPPWEPGGGTAQVGGVVGRGCMAAVLGGAVVGTVAAIKGEGILAGVGSGAAWGLGLLGLYALFVAVRTGRFPDGGPTRIRCPRCGNEGTAGSARLGEDAAFDIRGQFEGKAIRKCNGCGAGLAIGLFAGPRVIPPEGWEILDRHWRSRFGE